MARKDEMLKAFFKNEEFCSKYNIDVNSITTIHEAKQSQQPELVALGTILDLYEKDNTNPLYQQIITLLNEKL